MENTEQKKRKGFKSWYRKRRRLLQFIFTISFVVAIVVTIQILISQTDFFSTQHFEVYELNKSQLLYVDTRSLDSSIRNLIMGTNYFDLDVNDLETKIKETDHFIDEVFVDKLFPSGIIVELTERQPYLAYKDSEGCMLFDDLNRMIEVYEGKCSGTATKFNVPLLESTKDYEIYDPSSKSIRQYETIYKIIAFLGSENIDVINIKTENAKSTFIDRAQRKYIYNHESDVGLQLKRSLLVLGQIDFDKIEYKELDFRYERPVLRK